MASVLGPAALLFAIRGDVLPPEVEAEVEPVVDSGPPCCVEVVAAPAAPTALRIGHASSNVTQGEFVSASRWRAVDRTLPVGLAPERGLQVKTILASRAISAAFPEIESIGGTRPDALPWHPAGLALDVMIPNPGTTQGVALGNEIVAFVLRNAARFGMQDAIWRGVYYTPNGAQRGGGYGHYDHVHITTTGGGYPSGSEMYLR